MNDLHHSYQVKEVRLPRDRESGNRHKGFGYVEFGTAKDLESAFAMSGMQLLRRNVRIDIAEQQEQRGLLPTIN